MKMRERARAVVAALAAWPCLACSHTAPTASAAAPAPAVQASVTICTEPRRKICTHEYRPVCGCSGDKNACAAGVHSHATTWQEFSNACSACSHAEVVGTLAGRCR